MKNIDVRNRGNHANQMTSEEKGPGCHMRKMENELPSYINGMKGRFDWRILLDI